VELAGTATEVRIVAGLEGRDDAPPELVVAVLGEVLVGQVGSAVQLLRGQQAEDLGVLALAAAVAVGRRAVIGQAGFHVPMVDGRAGGSLSVRWPVRMLPS